MRKKFVTRHQLTAFQNWTDSLLDRADCDWCCPDGKFVPCAACSTPFLCQTSRSETASSMGRLFFIARALFHLSPKNFCISELNNSFDAFGTADLRLILLTRFAQILGPSSLVRQSGCELSGKNTVIALRLESLVSRLKPSLGPFRNKGDPKIKQTLIS